MSDQDKNILDKAADAAKDAYDSAAQGLKNLKEKIVGEPSTEDKMADKISDAAHDAADKVIFANTSCIIQRIFRSANGVTAVMTRRTARRTKLMS
jgi:hypothetical protein